MISDFKIYDQNLTNLITIFLWLRWKVFLFARCIVCLFDFLVGGLSIWDRWCLLDFLIIKHCFQMIFSRGTGYFRNNFALKWILSLIVDVEIVSFSGFYLIGLRLKLFGRRSWGLLIWKETFQNSWAFVGVGFGLWFGVGVIEGWLGVGIFWLWFRLLMQLKWVWLTNLGI